MSDIGSPDFRIGYRVFGSGTLKFLKNPDPYPIRKPEIFFGYPIRNIRNLKIGSDIRNFGSDRRIFGSDISDRIFLHTPRQSRQARLYVKLFTEAIYAIWLQRNNKVFNDTLVPAHMLVKEIVFRTACNCPENERTLLVN